MSTVLMDDESICSSRLGNQLKIELKWIAVTPNMSDNERCGRNISIGLVHEKVETGWSDGAQCVHNFAFSRFSDELHAI